MCVQALRDLASVDGVGIVATNGSPDRLTPPTEIGEDGTPHDSAFRPVIDAVIVIVDSAEMTGTHHVVGCGSGVIPDVAKSVPLTTGLRVPPVEDVVVARARVTAGDFVAERLTSEQRRIRETHAPIECEHLSLSHQLGRSHHPLGRQHVQTAEERPRVIGPHVPAHGESGAAGQVVVRRQSRFQGHAPTVQRLEAHEFRARTATRHHGRVSTSTDDRSPLHGTRVLDLTRVLAGPHCGRMLVDLGAEVVKIEPPDGDLTRFSSPRVGSLATYFIQQNAGKRCMSIDLSTPEGADLLIRLAEKSDVLVENYRAGVMDRLGLGPDVLRACNPRLVYASISGYGADGPWMHRRAYATVIGAESGLTRMQGESSGHFVNDPWSHADTYTALETTSAILAALLRRERTGTGDRIDVSMAETMLYVNEHAHDQLFDHPIDPQWIRSFRPGDYPILSVADGTVVVISGHPAERGTFEIMVRAMNRPHLLDDPRFADVETRLVNFEALRDQMIDWARSVPDADSFESICASLGLAVGVVRSVRELAESDWATARRVTTEVPDRLGGFIRVPSPPWHFTDAEVGTMGEPRYRGEDNRAVLKEFLGLADEEIDRLESRDVLSSRLPRRT